MKLGGPIFAKYDNPDSWVNAVQKNGYCAAYCPVKPGSDKDTIKAYKKAAEKGGIIIAEVGVWNNPLGPDEKARAEAIVKCKNCLQLADDIEANCCVNIAGSRKERWDGPCREDLTIASTWRRRIFTLASG